MNSAAQTPAAFMAQGVALYRHFDLNGELLYIGITNDPGRRWEQHRETSVWARYSAQVTLHWYPDRASAARAERELIRYERPIFNSARPGELAGQGANDHKIAYLRTGRSGLPRRVPCRVEPGAFCMACGPDLDMLYDRVAAEMASSR